MSKCPWAQSPIETRATTMRKIIRIKCAQRDIPSQSELARKTGFRISTLNSKFGSGAWTCEDIKALDKLLRFSAEELAQLVRA